MSQIYSAHAGCKYYKPDFTVGFKYFVLGAGEVLELPDTPEPHFVFVLSGALAVDFNEFTGNVVRSGHMIFMPPSADCRIGVSEDSEVMILSYSNPLLLCSKLLIEEMQPYIDGIDYEFRALDIRKPLMGVLQSVAEYMEHGIKCAHLYELKQQEITTVLRHYYTFREKAMLFYYSISPNVDFKQQVMSKYLRAKTVAELAEKCGYGLKSFQRLFQTTFGQPPYQWMQQQQAGHIKTRLLDPRIPIKAIVAEFGFSSQPHFNTYCKRHFDATPMQIRERGNRG